MKIKCLFITVCSIFLLGSSVTAYAQPKTMSDGTVFDAEFYANTYPDVKAAFGNDEKALYNHYVKYGKAEGRKATATTSNATTKTDFDPVFYANTYPDVKAAFGNDEKALYNHYIKYGKAEGRLATAGNTNGVTVRETQEEMEQVVVSNGDAVIPIQIWDYDPAIGPYFVENRDVTKEEYIRMRMENSGATRDQAEFTADFEIENRPIYPNMPRLTIHTKALAAYHDARGLRAQ